MALPGSSPGLRRLAGADVVLAAQVPALPQPDQLCGPFAAWAALHAVLDRPPSVADLARAAGTRVWPHDVPAWRPAGAPLDRRAWDALEMTSSPDESGTDAAGLARAVRDLCPTVHVVPARGPGGAAALVGMLVDRALRVGVLANLRTGPVTPLVTPPGIGWDVGHFVVLWGVAGELDSEQVAIADTYVELGAPGLPPGCRLVPAAALDAATAERGLLVLAHADDVAEVVALVADTGLGPTLWAV